MIGKENTRKFASVERMVEIANNAVDAFGELLNGRTLYDALSGSLKMTDEEILAAGFTTLMEFMEDVKKSQEEKFCDTCGSKIVFMTSAGMMASSEYIGTSTCRSCQEDYCRTTNCLGCRVGGYPHCKFASLKRMAMTDEEDGA